MSQGSAHAICAGVASANDDHVLVLCREIASIFVIAVQQTLGVGVQKLHREMNSLQAPRFKAQIARPRCTSAEHDRVKLLHQSACGIVGTDMRARNELDALSGHQIGASFNHRLFQLHVGNAVHQQTANAVSPLEDSYPMPGMIELRGASQTGWARPDHRNLFAGTHRGRFGKHPA